MKNIRIRKESVAQRVEAIRKTVVFAGVFLTALFLIGSLNGNTAKAASRKCYSICTGNTRVYSNTGLSRGIGWIYDSDQISVINVTRNWSQVSYPISRGRTKTGYIATSAILTATGGSTYTSRGKFNTYRRPGGSYYGYVAANDRVMILGNSGGYTQIKYPVSGGYKYAFAVSSEVNSKLRPQTAVSYGVNPQGYVDFATSPSNGTLRVSGWTFDRDSLGSKLQVHVYVGGPAGSGAPGYRCVANVHRPDVDNAFPGVGQYHGFDATFKVSRTGAQKIYVYAINVGGGSSNPLLGTKDVTIQGTAQSSGTNYTRQMICITSNGQTVDTFHGVAAKYITGYSDVGTYSCARYVSNYYRSVYGITVANMFTGRTPSASSGSFYRTTSPAEGDIGYQTNSRGSGHWFIIKAVNSDGTYTVIEQNWKWKSGGRTYCYKNRRVSNSTKGFKVFRWSGR